ncbi:GIY-YIG nuclease family protein [Roseateles saccharophilus]|uniref:T5orf172 domain-containing protein n=1 Tax=Roseateles saccharophilus TaxID=304 RepID=A0A4R3U861_ROSSA|nr:GIY-YIG nuclease family protein [Roseateles saccharophilus]MDG0835776.1 GIY-YIG nuclease family protein [Roseateles saccharophilus]TCU84183.1 T5orf172 domain-containing protein [Roseateles saccharophilus]
MAEIVYVLTNEAMPGLVKIGRTSDDVSTRVANLSAATGVPLPFECYFAAEVKDCAKLEKVLHQLFSENRVNPRREFFKVEPERVILAISIGDFTEITPGDSTVDKEEQEALEKIKARRPKIKLDAIGIKVGDTLTFSRDENITATVAAGGKIIFKGETLSPSAAALKVLHSLGYKTPSASGSEYWMFDGELLDERRKRLEAKQFEETATDDS